MTDYTLEDRVKGLELLLRMTLHTLNAVEPRPMRAIKPQLEKMLASADQPGPILFALAQIPQPEPPPPLWRTLLHALLKKPRPL